MTDLIHTINEDDAPLPHSTQIQPIQPIQPIQLVYRIKGIYIVMIGILILIIYN